MTNLSKDNRRATRDLDLDFIRYPLTEEGIEGFINKLNFVDDGIKIELTGKIKNLRQDDYKGKRVFLSFSDGGRISYDFKLDLGVHTNLELEQDELCFDLGGSLDSVTLFANSKEQIVAEKLKSLLKHGALSTRGKDVFDIYYLTTIKEIDVNKFKDLISDYILNDYKLKIRTFKDIYKRLSIIFLDKNFKKSLEFKEDNWLQLPVDSVVEKTLEFFSKL